jgi:hypothetical protein
MELRAKSQELTGSLEARSPKLVARFYVRPVATVSGSAGASGGTTGITGPTTGGRVKCF